MKPFPLPLVPAVGPGSQTDEAPEYLPMPSGMATYHPPSLPDPEDLLGHDGCVNALREALAALRHPQALQRHQVVELGGLGDDDRRLLNQVLGEGEVAAQVLGEVGLRVQESVFAGVWRVVQTVGGQPVRDTLEVGAIPQGLVDAALAEGRLACTGAGGRPLLPEAPAGVMNAPSLLAELRDRQHAWQPGDEPHVVNLTLLPLSEADTAHLDAVLGAGRVLVLSRGYGNCRIANTRWPRVWRVTYFNSTDINILDTLEVSRVPDVACAAAEDLQDSAERLAEVLDWVKAA